MYKSELIKALMWYEQQLTKRFVGMPLSSYVVDQAQSYLTELQRQQTRCEHNPVWQVEVKIVANPANSSIGIDVVDTSNILFLDFDEFH